MNMMVSASALAAASAVAVTPSVAEPIDPIFEAIERYKTAYDRAVAAMEAKDEAGGAAWQRAFAKGVEEAPPEIRAKFQGVEYDREAPGHLEAWQEYGLRHIRRAEQDSPEYQSASRHDKEASKEWKERTFDLAETVPATAAGAVALLSFVRERTALGDDVGGQYLELEDDQLLEHVIMESVEAYFRNQLN